MNYILFNSVLTFIAVWNYAFTLIISLNNVKIKMWVILSKDLIVFIYEELVEIHYIKICHVFIFEIFVHFPAQKFEVQALPWMADQLLEHKSVLQ